MFCFSSALVFFSFLAFLFTARESSGFGGLDFYESGGVERLLARRRRETEEGEDEGEEEEKQGEGVEGEEEGEEKEEKWGATRSLRDSFLREV